MLLQDIDSDVAPVAVKVRDAYDIDTQLTNSTRMNYSVLSITFSKANPIS